MKTRKMACLLFVVVLCGVVASSALANTKVIPLKATPFDVQYVPDRFIVVLTEAAGSFDATDYRTLGKSGINSLDLLAGKYAIEYMRPQFIGAAQRGITELSRYYKVQFIGPHDLQAVMDAYAADPLVDHVEPIGIHPMYATPNDGYYDPYQWYHNQTSDHDIDSPEAWDIQTGSDNLIIALLDSGVRYYHPDLGGVNGSPSNPGASRGNMWINTTELNGSSGVDDDGNGYTDDWIGYDFIDGVSNCWPGEDCNTKDNDPRDFNGHGTHTAGIMGMLTNDGYGMAGTAGGWGNGSQAEYGNGVKVMCLRMGYSYNYLGQEYGVVMMDAAAEAFYYAADNGAKIASCSWGSSNSGGIGAAATYFINNGGIIVVAAGNDGAEVSPPYLNSRGDCISVAATDENDNGASFTTYGTWVNICAPGNNIYSTYHDHYDPNTNYWASMGGTSMAAPMTAAVCGLIWSQNPGWSAAQVEDQLYSSADNIDAYLSSKYIGKMGAGRINSYNAVNTGTPPPVANFSGSPTSGCVPLTVNFTDLSTGDITSWDWTFGDGGTSTGQNPSHQYTTTGTFTVSLTVTGPGGSDTETKTGYITVSDVPTAAFTGSPTSGEIPLTVNFTNQSSGATSYSWDFGDTQTSTATNPSHTYTEAGTYTVTLTATNACGSDDEVKTDYITVTCTPPVANFSGSPTSGEVPLTVNFTDLSTGATSWSWDFGDGVGTSTAQNPSHEYANEGTYTVTLTAINACGSDQEIKTDYITVDPCTPPVADFSGSPTLGEAPLTVTFTDLSTGAASWDWDFGDGIGTSTAQNPSYEYTAEGLYTVTLTVSNACGSDIATKVDYIEVTEPEPPTRAYALSDIPVYGTITGDFTDTYVSDNGYEVLTEVLSTSHPRKTTSQLEHKWNINLPVNTSATFYVEAYRTANSEGDDFTFAYSADDATYINMVTVASTVEQVYSATLPTNLSGIVYIRVIDGNRSWDNNSLDAVYVDELYIEYSSEPAPPVAEFAGNPTSGTVPLTVNFTDLSTGSPDTWSWDFGDGVGTSAAQHPTYEYTAIGTYTVSLTVTNTYGSDGETKIDYITVSEVGDYMYVHDMVVGRKVAGPNNSGQCAVTIYDNLSQPLEGAAVYVTATGPVGGDFNGVTGTDGIVNFETGKIKNPSGEWCFEVTNVTHASYTYDPGANNVTKACESGWVYGSGPHATLIPSEFGLGQNYPNPFNAATVISFSLREAGHVTLEVYNIAGRKVATLVDGWRSTGEHDALFEASDLSSGIYFYRLQTGNLVQTKKMILMK